MRKGNWRQLILIWMGLAWYSRRKEIEDICRQENMFSDHKGYYKNNLYLCIWSIFMILSKHMDLIQGVLTVKKMRGKKPQNFVRKLVRRSDE